MPEELLYKIAISMMPGVNAHLVERITQAGISLHDFMTCAAKELAGYLGSDCNLGQLNLEGRTKALERAKEELDFTQRNKIKVFYISDSDYPYLMREMDDPPIVFYALGNGNPGAPFLSSIVGTRRCTHYGIDFCKNMIQELASAIPEAGVVSGLAYGIDAAAHVGALDNSLMTIAVMAHGLDMIYPAAHRDLAREIVEKGGAIITEYPHGTKPHRRQFLERNRIVAGMSEATLIVESEIKGGAMSTANLAFNYNRVVSAVPGRYNDTVSAGCNHLISINKAKIFTTMSDLIQEIGWSSKCNMNKQHEPPGLFIELEGDLATIFDIVSNESLPISTDELHRRSGLSMSIVMSALSDLEFEGLITKLPGSKYVKQ